MSQAVNNSQIGEPDEKIRVEIEDKDDLAAAEAYVQDNPGTVVLLDYQNPVISRGWGESGGYEDTDVHVRSLGGATTYEDSNSYGIIQSGGCFEDFQEKIISQAEEVIEGDIYVSGKDPYLDQDRGRKDPKVLGFGGRMDTVDLPNLYGVSWREGTMEDETRAKVENDVTPVIPEEVENNTFHFRESGESLAENFVDFEQKSVRELLEETEERDMPNNRTSRQPESCAVDYRPEENFSIDRSKLDTATYAWHTS